MNRITHCKPGSPDRVPSPSSRMEYKLVEVAYFLRLNNQTHFLKKVKLPSGEGFSGNVVGWERSRQSSAEFWGLSRKMDIKE